MPQVINTNIASLTAQRNLNTSQSALNVSLQRLSSGLRINSAKDDAAGLAISERMTGQIRGLNQASRNANDGISLAQTAEGSLGEITNNLQRIRELAVQSANATNSAADRAALQTEVSQLRAEISRVASQTEFNGTILLDGSFASQSFQVGANANQTVSVSSFTDARATALGSHTLAVNGTITGNAKAPAADLAGGNLIAVETDLTITTTNGGTTPAFGYAALSDAKQIAAAINTAASGIGVTATASSSARFHTLASAGTVSMELNGTAISAVVADATDLTALVQNINGSSGATGITASFTGATKADITLTTSDGRDIRVLNFNNTGTTKTVSFAAPDGAAVTLDAGIAGTDSSIATGTVSLSSSKGQMTTALANADVFATAGLNTSLFASLAGADISTAAGAQAAIGAMDAALASVNSSRADLGALQNRFSTAVANIAATSENLTASRSRIQDADFAMEMTSMTRAQIMQQAGMAMLSQANSLPSGVLALLR